MSVRLMLVMFVAALSTLDHPKPNILCCMLEIPGPSLGGDGLGGVMLNRSVWAPILGEANAASPEEQGNQEKDQQLRSVRTENGGGGEAASTKPLWNPVKTPVESSVFLCSAKACPG